VQRDLPPQPIKAVTLTSSAGLRVTLLNLGATIQAIEVPVSNGVVNAVLGYANYDDYWTDSMFMGATVGRFANRIRGAQFSLDGRNYPLDSNEDSTGHCLHGGRSGFHRQFWAMRPDKSGESLVCHYVSSDGEGGFPGNLEVSVNYQIINDYSLAMEYRATTDAPTIISLANHAYFNLDRNQSAIDTHRIQIDAEYYTPVDKSNIPTGEIRNVRDSKFDLRRMIPIRDSDTPADNGLRIDHNFVLRGNAGKTLAAAEIYSVESGLGLRVHTSQRGLQLYTGDHLTRPFHPRQGLCLETQGYPDAPNQAAFPSARLAPGELYRERTIYEFLPAGPYF